MKKIFFFVALVSGTTMFQAILVLGLLFSLNGCQKDAPLRPDAQALNGDTKSPAESAAELYPFNLNVTLVDASNSESKSFGYIEFRQNPDTARIITLTTTLARLKPNHAYMLQRAVDPITSTACLSVSWLTLGLGLIPYSITTNNEGNAKTQLWRAVTSIARGTAFYIHFQVVDTESLQVVLVSDCYQYQVR